MRRVLGQGFGRHTEWGVWGRGGGGGGTQRR